MFVTKNEKFHNFVCLFVYVFEIYLGADTSPQHAMSISPQPSSAGAPPTQQQLDNRPFPKPKRVQMKHKQRKQRKQKNNNNNNNNGDNKDDEGDININTITTTSSSSTIATTNNNNNNTSSSITTTTAATSVSQQVNVQSVEGGTVTIHNDNVIGSPIVLRSGRVSHLKIIQVILTLIMMIYNFFVIAVFSQSNPFNALR